MIKRQRSGELAKRLYFIVPTGQHSLANINANNPHNHFGNLVRPIFTTCSQEKTKIDEILYEAYVSYCYVEYLAI